MKLFVRISRIYDSCFLIAITRYLAALVGGGIGLRRSVKGSEQEKSSSCLPQARRRKNLARRAINVRPAEI